MIVNKKQKKNHEQPTLICLNLIDFLTTTIHSIYQWASLRELASNERILLYIFFLSFFFVIKTNTKYTAKPDMHVEQRNCDSCVWRCVLCACLLCIDRLSLTTTTRERQRQLYIYNWRRRRTSLINHTISVFTLGSVVLFFREISSDGATQSRPFFCLNNIFVKELVGPFSGNASHLEAHNYNNKIQIILVFIFVIRQLCCLCWSTACLKAFEIISKYAKHLKWPRPFRGIEIILCMFGLATGGRFWVMN